MSLKSMAAKWLASRDVASMNAWAQSPEEAQMRTFEFLRTEVVGTRFGKDHQLDNSMNPDQWRDHVPVADYEKLSPYVDLIKKGERDVLYPGMPAYFCKTSGTTSGTKYIPMTDHGIKAQVRAARLALLSYINEQGNASFIDGKMMFLQGSPEMEKVGGVNTGRLSGIVAHHVPAYLQKNRMPSWKVNCMSNWEEKVDAIARETRNADLRLISGIPPWVQMYFERLLELCRKSTVMEVFPNLQLFVHGGVNYQPYRAIFEGLIGRPLDVLETYPASEGFIAFQDQLHTDGLLLNLDAGIFYEFIPVEEIHDETPSRLRLWEVEQGRSYALVLNTSSGLWGYLIGDTIRFVSVNPYRIQVTGRIAHFISAFGEHVIAQEVEAAMTDTANKFGIKISEFHVAPEVNPMEGLPYHEWFIELVDPIPKGFSEHLDQALRSKNAYYDDLIKGRVLRPLVISPVPKGTFNAYMDSIGKLGGQNKLPRLSNDRTVADKLTS